VQTFLADQSEIHLDGNILLYGRYVKEGVDLRIETDLDTVVIKDYFVTTPLLISHKGSVITPHMASLLTLSPDGPLLAFDDPQAIGQITLATDTVTIVRANQTIQLKQGDYIYLNDVIQSDKGNVGITFLDETSMSIEPGSRLVVDEFVYAPEENTGKFSTNVVTGNFSFVSGKIAKLGNDVMTVKTPVLTIGVRGTEVAGRASQEGEANEIVLLPNEDGSVGQIAITTQAGTVLLTQAFEGTTIESAFLPPAIPVILPKDVVLKKFAKTIATTKTTKKTRETDKKAKDAQEKKEKLKEDKEQAEKEKAEKEAEKKELEEKLADEDLTEEEKAELEEQLVAVDEKIAEAEQKVEQVEQEVQNVEREIEEIKQEVQAFKEELKAEFGEAFAEIEQAVDQAIEQAVEKVDEVMNDKPEDPFDQAEEENINEAIDEKMEEEIQKLDDEVIDEKMEDDVFDQKEEDAFKDEPAQDIPDEDVKMDDVKIDDVKMDENVFVAFQDDGKYGEESLNDLVEDSYTEEDTNTMLADILADDNLFDEPVYEQADINYAPVFSAQADVTIEENNATANTLIATVKASDANGDPIIYSLDTDESGNLTIDSAGKISIVSNFNVSQDQSYLVTVKAADGKGLDDFLSFYLNVNNSNTAPTLTAIADKTVATSLASGSTIATASASDADGDTITYSLTQDTSGILSINSSTGAITTTGTFSGSAGDSYTVTVQASDGSDTVTDTFTITLADNLALSSIHTTGDGTADDYAQTIGYVGTDASQVSSVITSLGHTAVNFVPGTTNINSVDVLWYLNPDNSGWYENLGAYQTAIFDWVYAGGIFIIHDRYVTGANSFLLGESMTITREFNDSANYNIIDESSSNLLREGPGGTLTDASGGNIWGTPNADGEFNMDGGGATAHGSASYSTFDLTNELALGTKADSNSVIDFIYKYGAGAVYYSTIPMDYYITSSTSAQAYAKNAVHFATSLIFDGYSTIKGTASGNTIWGTGGDDVIQGLAGNDTIYGLAGDDTLEGGAGADSLYGGAGSDTFKYSGISDSVSSSKDIIYNFDSVNDSIDISSITSGATVRLTGTDFEIDVDQDGNYDMMISLNGFTGVADDVTVVTSGI
jgi:Ca2+-binding RTX toxin-like protein